MATMSQDNPYEVLGVSRDAPQDEIRKAYLKLAHKYHPDKTGGDKASEEKLKSVNAAYDILKNKDKRAAYDRYGTTDGQPFGAGGAGGFGGGGFGGADFEAPFDDFFDMLFGQGKRRVGGAGRRVWNCASSSRWKRPRRARPRRFGFRGARAAATARAPAPRRVRNRKHVRSARAPGRFGLRMACSA